MAGLSWFQVCLFCVCVLLTFLGSIVSTVQARGRGWFFEVRFPSERPGQWHPTTSVHIQNIGLNYNCRPKAFYDHSIRIEAKGGGRLSIFLIWEAKRLVGKTIIYSSGTSSPDKVMSYISPKHRETCRARVYGEKCKIDIDQRLEDLFSCLV